MDEHEELIALRRRVDELANVCGEAYQVAGEVGAPWRVLDKFLAAASGDPIPQESMLPIRAER